MNVLVTGGLGFLGSTLLTMLRDAGYRVVSYDRRALDSTADSTLAYVQGDLLDLPLLLETIRKYSIDRIIHTAAISHPVVAIDIPYQTVLTNALGTANVLEAARMSGIKRVVNLSSEYAYGHNAHLGTTSEDVPLHPTGVYGATKVFTEKLARAYMNHYGMEVPSLRPGWIYGPGQFMQCYMKTLLRNAIDGVPTNEPEGRAYEFQYVHVEDVAQACIRACMADTMESYVYSITAGHKTSLEELAKIVIERYPSASITIGEGTIPALDRYATFDISSAKRELGYEPRYDTIDGVHMYASWLQNHPF
jgi:nucleoside-diphosphate-sugar epimerase